MLTVRNTLSSAEVIFISFVCLGMQIPSLYDKIVGTIFHHPFACLHGWIILQQGPPPALLFSCFVFASTLPLLEPSIFSSSSKPSVYDNSSHNHRLYTCSPGQIILVKAFSIISCPLVRASFLYVTTVSSLTSSSASALYFPSGTGTLLSSSDLALPLYPQFHQIWCCASVSMPAQCPSFTYCPSFINMETVLPASSLLTSQYTSECSINVNLLKPTEKIHIN